MAYMLKIKCDYCWVPDGAGGSMLGQSQSDFPGYGTTATNIGAGTVPGAQEASDQVGEVIPGGDSPSGANFQTALNNAAADLYTRLTTPGSSLNSPPGFVFGAQTLLSVVQGFATGNP